MNEKNWKSEIAAGLMAGIIVGIIMAILALSIFNIWYLLLSQKNGLTYATIIIWASFAMSPALYYQTFHWTIRNLAFTAGLFIAIGLINYVYNTNSILPYSSLATVKIVALVGIGLSIGLILIKSKRAETKKLHSRI